MTQLETVENQIEVSQNRVIASRKVKEESGITATEKLKMIKYTAYMKAVKRDLKPGGEIQDWLSSEREIDDLFYQSGMSVIS